MLDLRICKYGDFLISTHDTVLTYLEPLPTGSYYDHLVQYPDGSKGTRCHDGRVYRKNHQPEDEDIFRIIPKKAYKAFYLNDNGTLSCLRKKYEVGTTYSYYHTIRLCSRGYHCCSEMEDCFLYYPMNSVICEVEILGDEIKVDIDGSKLVTNKLRIVRKLSRDEIIDNIKSSGMAYHWAMVMGDKEKMASKITYPNDAFYWAKNFGNKEIMIDKITDSEYAYAWAREIGNQDIMIDRITESEYAYYWAFNIGDQEIMRDRITEPRWAYLWARDFGDEELMCSRSHLDGIWYKKIQDLCSRKNLLKKD